MTHKDIKEAIEELKELQSETDIERAHADADAILCRILISLGCVDVVKEWEKVEKWYA